MTIRVIMRQLEQLLERPIPQWCGGVAGLITSWQSMSHNNTTPTSIEIDRRSGGFSCMARPATLKMTRDRIWLTVEPKYRPTAEWVRERIGSQFADLIDQVAEEMRNR